MSRTSARLLLIISGALIAACVIAGAWLMANTSAPEPEAAQPASSATTPATKAPESASTRPTAAPQSTRTAQPSVKPATKADQLGIKAATIMTTWDPAKDVDETASEARAKHLMTPKRAGMVAVSDRGTTTREWTRAAAKGWTSKPTAVIAPSDQRGRVVVNVTWDWVDANGKKQASGEKARQFVFVTTDTKDPRIIDYTWLNLR